VGISFRKIEAKVRLINPLKGFIADEIPFFKQSTRSLTALYHRNLSVKKSGKFFRNEAVSKCFPLTAGFKIKEGDPAMAGLTTGIH
jgi:hypothetical protein